VSPGERPELVAEVGLVHLTDLPARRVVLGDHALVGHGDHAAVGVLGRLDVGAGAASRARPPGTPCRPWFLREFDDNRRISVTEDTLHCEEPGFTTTVLHPMGADQPEWLPRATNPA
jgi:hypothetical protein